MSERAKFFNRRNGDAVGKYTYSAEDFAEFFNTFFSDGVVGTGLRISTSDMGIVVNSGYAIISGHWYNNDSSLTLLNPSVVTTKRKDSIAIKLDKSDRTITAVWITGSADSYPVLVDDSDIKYIKLADIELLAGGVIKAVYDKRPYCHALYTLSLDEFNEHWDNFLRVCNNNYNQYVRKSTATSELIKARGGYDVLSSRLSIIDYLLELLFETATENLFDKQRLIIGELDNKGSIDNSITNSFTTDYISINDGMTLYFWDRNGNPVMPETTEWYSNKSADGLIKYINYAEDTSAVNDCHAKYIRLSFNNTIVNADNLQITLSDKAPSSYIAFAYKVKEQLKQIQSNTATIAKLEAETTASIKNINAKLNKTLKTGYEDKTVSILGDSISTFEGWIPETHRARYPQDDLLTDVEKTWWKMLIKNLGATLGVNDSWAGTTISNYSETNSGDTGPDACMAGITRIKNLGSNGTPDVIIMYGGTNDIHIDCDNRLGTFDTTLTYPLDTSTQVWTTFADAFKDALMRLQSVYPLAEIIVLLPGFTKSYYAMNTLNKYNSMMKRICNYFGVKYIDLRTCGVNWSNLDYTLGDGIHPNAKGMELIEKGVRKAMLSTPVIDETEDVKTFTATVRITGNGVTTSNYNSNVQEGDTFKGYIELADGYGISTACITMGGETIVNGNPMPDMETYFLPVGNKMYITVPNVTGDITVGIYSTTSIANTRHSDNQYVQEIPLAAMVYNNLYKVLEPQDSYYNSSGNYIEETPILPSIVIPVLAGDKIYSNSFGDGSWLDEPRQGIRITYLCDNEVIQSVAPADIYTEFMENGYITVPAGINAVCIPWWSKSDNNVLRIMTLHKMR